MRRTLSLLVHNRAGVLARIAGLFSRRGFNIESIAVGATEDPAFARMTVVCAADEAGVEQITKQLNKLVDVLRVSDITDEPTVDRELALIKVTATQNTRPDVLQIVNIFRASIVDVGERTVIVEVTGDEGKIDAIIQLLHPFGIKELVRTGKVAMTRGAKPRSGESRAIIAAV